MNKIPLVTALLFVIILNAFSQSQFEKNPVQYTSAKEKAEAYARKDIMSGNSLFKNLAFKSIGPSIMSGRVVDVEVNPADPTIFYVAYASGGLWKTTNNGISFSSIFDAQETISLGDIDVDWQNSIIYAGTGENNSSRSSYPGTGIYKSTNDGKDWENIGLEEIHRTGRIIIDPKNPNRIWVAALGNLFSPNPERGIYRTTNGGKTWDKTLYIDDVTGGIDLAVNPDNTNIVYASMWYRERKAWHGFESGSTSGIYKSTDGGSTWNKISTPQSGFPSGDGLGRIGLALYTKNPDIIYALLDNLSSKGKKDEDDKDLTVNKELLRKISKEDFLKLKDEDIEEYLAHYDFPKKYTVSSISDMIRSEKIKPADLVDYVEDAETKMFNTDVIGAEVYRSNDAGKTWTKTNDNYIKDMFYTYGYYFGNIRVSSSNPDKIYLMGVPIIKSEDGGKTFKSISEENVHSDHHALWINPNREGHLINGNDGGINISYDDGKTWFKANTPAVGQFYSVNVDMEEPFNVYGGLQDNGTWYGPSNYKTDYGWYQSGQYPYKSIMGGDGMQVAIDTRDNNTVYAGYQFGNYYRIDKAKKDYKYITPKHELGEKHFRWNWQSPIQISKHNQDIIYFGSNKLHRSLNKGDNFDVISGDLTNGGKAGKVPFGTLTTIHESPLMFGLIYTGSDDGAVHVTRTGGYEWKKISDNLPQNYWISRVQASMYDTGTVYVTLSGFRWDNFEALIYRSRNYGDNFERIGKDIPIGPVNVIKEDPENKNIIYAGTDNGVYVSVDGGKNFFPMVNGLPKNVPVHDLVIHPRDKQLVIGTHGRSIYLADVQHLQKLTEDVLARNIVLFDIKPLTFSKNWGKKTYEWSEIKLPSVTFTVYAGNSGTGKILIKTDKETTVKEFTIQLDGGLNYIKYDLTAENGAIYLTPGKYTVEAVFGGSSDKKELTIKERSREKRE